MHAPFLGLAPQGSHTDELEMLHRRLLHAGKQHNLLGGPSWSECSRAGEALFRVVRRDRRWELEEGDKEAACGTSIQGVQGMG